MNVEPTEYLDQAVGTEDNSAQQAVIDDSAPRRRRSPSAPGKAVGGGDVDTVYLSSCVFKSTVARKSLSVHHVQRRLAELGYPDAYTDKDGWYGDLTKMAVAAYQEDCGMPGDGVLDADTLRSLFDDDPNVEVSIEL